MPSYPCLAPLAKEARPQPDPIVLDIETWGLDARPGAFAMGVLYEGPTVPAQRFTSRDEMVAACFAERLDGRQLYAHNGGGYDYLSLFGNLFTTFGSDNVCMVGGRFIEARKQRGKHLTRFRDSLNLLPTSVEALGEKLGVPKGITPQKFKDGARAEGLDEQDFVYCERDCEVVWRSLMGLKAITGELRATVPSTAMAIFRRQYLQSAVWIRRENDGAFHPSYYGGRVEAYRLGNLPGHCYSYDVNSLYPKSMIAGPFPNPAKLVSWEPTDVHMAYNALWTSEGMMDAYVEHDPTYIGYLPKKLPGGKLIFPTGRFWGSWAFPELRYAVKHQYVRLLHVRKVVSSPAMPSPFTEYVNDMYGRKKTAQGFERELFKLFLNGLYGKFAETHHEREIYAEQFSIEEYEKLEAEYGEVLWQPMGRLREDGYYVCHEDEAVTQHTIYSWASYITSYARALNAEIQDRLRASGLAVFYTDTDSFLSDAMVVADGPVGNLLGEELGLLKLEDKVVTKIFGNKDYELADGHYRIKGVKKDAKRLGDNAFEFRGVTKLRSALRRGVEPGTPFTMVRNLAREYDKREVLPDGETAPLKLYEAP